MIPLTRRRLLQAIAAASTMPALHAGAQATYPGKPIRLIVPAAAGGATDIIGRLVAHQASLALPQPMVVENVAGGGGVIGTQVVARASGDGHTLLMGAINHTINASLVSKLPYDSVKDFTFISHLVSIPNVLVVHPSLPVTTLAEFIQYARTHDTLVFASSGNGTSQHLSAEMFRMATGVKYQHVPYKGAAPATNDLLGGHVHLMFDNLPAAAPNIRAGKLRALAVTSARRNAAFPDLPAIAETVPGFDVRSWFGLMGPAGMPRPVVDKLHAEMVRIFTQPEVLRRIADMGAEAQVTDPAAFNAYVHQEMERWAKVVKASGATVQ
ncbi:Bug family tripartite tricarboxylate transporter substrate binding protein [Alicycliphilus denitrificans]|uniref:Tripartite tricarboxylate transporter substrate binding protein n=1 Tax=Alicycliphilus denitrificans TaxID=179636 RepID=A0A3R7LDT0_9BURK|nr:tripartite tricarboxylate transporter substrate binding protein [Alicycliphilus denitrificans]RKJ94132.1 tripartite tricarboxylate transporter substrate binding protein [Alicycliphilus denitrificans]HRO81210.1 tripartite tricarboxylate transporter substrate binding protein [Alicycliphilus denitrificans]